MSDDGFGAEMQVEDDGTGSESAGATPSNTEEHSDPPPRQGTLNSLQVGRENAGDNTNSSMRTPAEQIISISQPESQAGSQKNLKAGLSAGFGASAVSSFGGSALGESTATAIPSSPSNMQRPDQLSIPQMALGRGGGGSTNHLTVDNGFGAQVSSTANSPAYAGSNFVSFRSSNTGGRSTAMSNVSGVFVQGEGYGGEDDDDPKQRAPGGGGGAGSGNKMTKKLLPQPCQNDEELEEELAAELFHVAESQSRHCNLSKLNIQRVPQELRTFGWVKELYLAENKIAILPDTIFIQMQLLEVLDLMENRLTTVPRSCFQLRSLRRLLLDHNRIYCLPDEIDPDPVERFGLPELTEIGLEWNNLMQFPTNLLLYAPKVEKMFLSENPGISTLPPPALLEPRKDTGVKTVIRLDNRPMLLQAAASNEVYKTEAGIVQLEWNKIYPDRVLDFLYLGSMRTAQCVEVYNDLDIGYVLTAARNLEVVLGPGMKHLTLPFDDLPGEDVSQFFDSSFKFIDEAVAAKRGILIHCFAGLSRSVAMTMGYLMKKYRLSADDALVLIRQSRPSAHPNEGFVTRLRTYTKELGITDAESATIRAELEKCNKH